MSNAPTRTTVTVRIGHERIPATVSTDGRVSIADPNGFGVEVGIVRRINSTRWTAAPTGPSCHLYSSASTRRDAIAYVAGVHLAARAATYAAARPLGSTLIEARA